LKAIIASILISLAALSISLYVYYTGKKEFVFVDLKYLFENFQYKKQLEKEFEIVLNYRRAEIDSLQLDIKDYMSHSTDQAGLDAKTDYLNQRKRIFQEDNLALSRELDKKIYKQLKQYIREYARDNHIQLVIGELEDNLSVVGPEETNRNQELLEFINKKFNNH
jgi:Skp family chaperone for outer membrane proteins